MSEPHGSIPWKEGWCIVSASEDSVVRIYSLQGSVLRELQGAKVDVGSVTIKWAGWVEGLPDYPCYIGMTS